MFYVILIALLVGGIAVFTLYIRRNPYDELPARKGEDCGDDCTTCADLCAASRVLDTQTAAPRYFNDDELDAFAGTADDAYSEEQVETFRNVFETVAPGDVAAWVESLRRRGIEIPQALKDEVLMLLGSD